MTLLELRKVLKAAVSTASCNGVVCALQPTKPTVRLSMEVVLQEAKNHGLQVHAYILDPDYSGGTRQAANIESKVQAAGFAPIVLDGRRFAHQKFGATILKN